MAENENARKNSPKTQHVWHLETPLGAYCLVSYVFRNLYSGTTITGLQDKNLAIANRSLAATRTVGLRRGHLYSYSNTVSLKSRLRVTDGHWKRYH